MSLINQALRKAQRDRTPNRMSDTSSGTPAQLAATTTSGMKPGLVIGLVVAVALLLGLVVGLSLVLFKGDKEPSAQMAQQDQAPATLAGQNEQAEVPSTPDLVEKIAPPAESIPLTRETSSPIVEELRLAREAAEAKAAAESKAAEEALARSTAKPSQDIIGWLARAQINGVKLSATESKVILNGKSYTEGEYVNFALSLKVMVIQEGRILFVDDSGQKYSKRL